MPDKASRHPNRPLNMRGAESGRAVALVREVATFGRQGARLTELIERCEIEYPTAHRIIKSLVAHEVLRKDETTRRYHLGQLLYELGLTAEPRRIFVATATRDRGYAAIGDVVCPGVRAVSLPFLVNSSAPLGAVSVAAVLNRLPTSRIPALVALIRTELDLLKRN